MAEMFNDDTVNYRTPRLRSRTMSSAATGPQSGVNYFADVGANINPGLSSVANDSETPDVGLRQIPEEELLLNMRKPSMTTSSALQPPTVTDADLAAAYASGERGNVLGMIGNAVGSLFGGVAGPIGSYLGGNYLKGKMGEEGKFYSDSATLFSRGGPEAQRAAQFARDFQQTTGLPANKVIDTMALGRQQNAELARQIEQGVIPYDQGPVAYAPFIVGRSSPVTGPSPESNLAGVQLGALDDTGTAGTGSQLDISETQAPATTRSLFGNVGNVDTGDRSGMPGYRSGSSSSSSDGGGGGGGGVSYSSSSDSGAGGSGFGSGVSSFGAYSGGYGGGYGGGWADGGMIGDELPGLTMRYADGGSVQGPLLSMGFADGGAVAMGSQPNPQMVNAQINQMVRDPQVRQQMVARAQALMQSGELTPEEVMTMGRVAEASLFNPGLYPQLRAFVAEQGMAPLPPAFDPSVIMKIVAISRVLQQSGMGGATPPGQVPPMNQAMMTPPTPGMAGGGMIHGPGSGRSDSIGTINETTGQPVKVANGEYVIPAHIVKAKGREFFDNLLRRYSEVPKE